MAYRGYEDKLNLLKTKMISAIDTFDSINIGDKLEIEHHDDNRGDNGALTKEINVHTGVVYCKTANQIFVKESEHKRQGITINQLISKHVKIRRAV